MATTWIYILHFNEPLAHARHYIGSTANLLERLKTHASGRGARITEVLKERGIPWELGGLYSCSHAEMRRRERAFKNQHNSERYCQICHPKDQLRSPGLQLENILNIKHARRCYELLRTTIEPGQAYELTPDREDEGMAYILSLMRKDKDALGFVPVGGVTGIKALLEKRQIILASEGTENSGYAFYTTTIDQAFVNIHQACVADPFRLRGHGARIVEFIARKHPEATLVAKVRDDLAANHFWTALGFVIDKTKTHKTSGSTIHHYHRQALLQRPEQPHEQLQGNEFPDLQDRRGSTDDRPGEL